MERTLLIRFAGVTIGLKTPFDMVISQDLEPFQIRSGEPDEIIAVSSLPRPQAPAQPPVFSSSTLRVCREAGGWCHIFPGLKGDDGSLCSFHWGREHNHVLYTPGSTAQLFQDTGRLAPFIVPELLLLPHGRFFLHSSLVMLQGKAVLFCGPSGIGKSTQAALWQHHLGAKILNGDRAVIYEKNGEFWASGSPYSGSSGIYSAEEAPIAAIVLLGQADHDFIRPAGAKEALYSFYQETIQHSWDEAYTDKLIFLLSELATAVPIYELQCRPHPEAAKLAKNVIFSRSPDYETYEDA